jgi:hypothetical protein
MQTWAAEESRRRWRWDRKEVCRVKDWTKWEEREEEHRRGDGREKRV